jgi:hypothetical protein
MLPFEDRARKELETACPKDLADCRELLELALRMIGSTGQSRLQIPQTPVGVTDRAKSLALGLYAKACKQFRGIIILAERGFGDEVTVLTRALFEATLAMNLIMNETVALKREGKPFDPDPSRQLTTDFRALLYWARAAFVQAKRYKQWSGDPGLSPSIHLLGVQSQIAAQTAQAKGAVGEKWWEALNGGQAGLSIRNLADSLGVLSYYICVYSDQSEVAHAGDAFMHFDLDDGSVDLAPSPASIGGLLQLAGLVFLGCLTGIHNRLNFGAQVELALDGFAKRFTVSGSWPASS